MSVMTSIDPDPDLSIAARAGRAAGCAFVSVAAWMAIAYGVIQARGCEGGMECLGDALGVILLCLIAAALTMWPLLVWVKVRPAWAVALAGPGVFLLIAFGLLFKLVLGVPPLWVIVIMASYALGAVLVDGRVRPMPRIVAVAVLLVLVVVRFALPGLGA